MISGKTNRRNAIVGQSGGPTSAINSSLAGVIDGVRVSSDIDILYGAFNGVEGILNERICNLSDIFASCENIALLRQTPAAALGSCRKKLKDYNADPETYKKVFTFFEKYNIGYFFYIGGNDSMDTVSKLSLYANENGITDVHFIGVPKTIDNDLEGTDHTPGFGSASKYIATTMSEIVRDTAVYTVKAVTIVEIMGRDAGWLSASAALPRIINGASPDLVYLPEVAFDYEECFSSIEKAFEKHPNVVIALSEGTRFANGRYIGEETQSGVLDAFGHRYLQGTAKALEAAVKERFGCKTRSVELNLPQRCASHTASYTDITEAYEVGKAAVRYAPDNTSVMICMERSEPYAVSYVPKDVSTIANMIKKVPREYINKEGNNVTDECLEYLLPLIKGEWNTVYKDGLPVHFEIKK